MASFVLRTLRVLVLLHAAPVVLTAGCESTPEVTPCGILPEKDACPASEGGTCADVSCTAIYKCTAGQWSLVQRCQSPVDAGSSDAAAMPDAQVCQPTMIPGGPTCTPLEAPDCDASLVDQCPAMACSTGCTGFLRCTAAGWSTDYVAYCDEGGTLVKSGK